MIFTKHRNLTRWIIVIASFAIISLILWNTYVFFQNFKSEERIKMQNWSYAQKEIGSKSDLDEDISELPLQILVSNTTTPMILVGKDGKVQNSNNVDEEKIKDSVYVQKLIKRFESENTPIVVKYGESIFSTLYYGNSTLINKLKYYPLALLLIIFLFSAVVYFFYKSSKTASENKLWSGMAKETAHQIGTPLSSLIGWTEILKNDNVNPEYIAEIEKDVNRLQTITDRFSKIGSIPTLEKSDIVNETVQSYEYLKTRTSKLVEFNLVIPENEIMVHLNRQLYSWAIENLVKNAIDAMKGKGQLTVEILQLEKIVKIKVTDSGKGIPKKQYQTIFEPGYTTKKRGWGLGLSLTKRIIEDFHNGKIKVANSGAGIGTSMEISLKSI